MMQKSSILSLLLVFALAGCSSSSNHDETASTAIDIPEIHETEVKSVGASDTQIVQPPQLGGNWRSEKPEPAGNGRYAVRELKVSGSRWEMTYTLASDKQMKNILFVHKASGTVTIQSPSKRIPGAYLVVYGFNHKTLDINTTDKTILKEMGFEDCSISPKREVDITSRGCGIIPRIGECPNDYDLLRQETRNGGEFISIGNKFAEFSACSEDKRPVALGAELVKVK